MSKQQAQQQMKKLYKLLDQYAREYFDLDAPSVSDMEYDELMNQLTELEQQYPEWIEENSPTQRVGGYASARFEKVEHSVQMGSLQDVFSLQEIHAFDQRVKKTIENPQYVVEVKIDGLSVSLEYERGVFVRGSTRGDGHIGENVTHTLNVIQSVPKKLNQFIDYIEVRGEVYLSKKAFEKLLKTQQEQGETPFKNPRNAAAGSLRQKDAWVAQQRGLDIFAFNVQQIKGYPVETHSESLELLEKLGFVVSPGYYCCDNILDAVEKIKEIGEKRNQFPFEIDGAVVKLNNLEDRKRIGYTTKHPKWAVAFKYPAQQKQTILHDIEISVGRTGVLTPAAIFEPVELSGSLVGRATLHNQDYITQKDIRIGDTILLQKAGDIIPEVIASVAHQASSIPYEMSMQCPSCGQKAVRMDQEVALRCVNPSCAATRIKNILHFVSRDAMNIEGLGEKILLMLLDHQLIEDSADLYKIKPDQLLTLERMGEKSANNLCYAIEQSKKNGLARLLYGLGIRNVGKKAAQLVSEAFGSIDRIMKATTEQLEDVMGLGEVIAGQIVLYFSSEQAISMICRFKEAGVKMTHQVREKNHIWEGKTFVFTGKLTTITRNQAKNIIESNGGLVSNNISKKTTYLVAGQVAGSKLTKAKQCGVTILTEEQFQQLLHALSLTS